MRPVLASLALLCLLVACGHPVDPATAVADARALVSEGKPGEARILLKNALADGADLPEARVVLARIALDEGNVRAAADELAAVQPGLLRSPEAIQVQVEVALGTGRADQAGALLEQSADSLPGLQRVLLQAAVLRASGEPAQALLRLRTAQQLEPKQEQLVVEVAAVLASMGELSAAMAELDRYLESADGPRADALRVRGDLKLRQGHPPEAIEDFRAALANAPAGWPWIHRVSTELMVADALLASGDTAGAGAQLDQIDKRWPGMRGAETLRAQLALREGRYGEATDRLAALLDAAPGNVRLQYLLIDALVRAGNTGRAIELLERRVAEEPAGSSPARGALAALLMQQGRPDRVISLLSEEGETQLQAAGSDDLLAAARLARARASEAIASLATEARQRPDDPAVKAALAAAQVANGEPAAALVTLGEMPARGWTPQLAAARMGALLAMGNELEITKAVDRLLDPESQADAPTLVAAADVLQRQRRSAAVGRLLDRAQVLDAGSSDVQLRRANLAFEAGRHEEAGRILRDLVASHPELATARVALARVSEAGGDADAARATLRDTIAANPSGIEPSLMLASLELRADRPAQASAAIEALLQANSEAEAAYSAGLLYAQSRQFEQARTRFRQAVDRAPGNAGYWFNLGQSQLALADRAAARESFVRAASLQPGSVRAAAAAVRLSVEQQDAPTARRIADATVRAVPANAAAWLLQGEAAWAAGDADGARQSFARSTTLQPTAAAALGEFRSRAVQAQARADAPLLGWLSREPQDQAVRRVLADFYMTTGNTRGATAQLELLLKQAPNDIVTLNNLAWQLREADRQRAQRLALQANAIAPDNPAVADTLGAILIANGEIDSAVTLLAGMAKELPDDRTIKARYAQALVAAGKRAEARVVLQGALAGNVDFPGRAEARRLMEEL